MMAEDTPPRDGNSRTFQCRKCGKWYGDEHYEHRYWLGGSGVCCECYEEGKFERRRKGTRGRDKRNG